MKKIYILIFLIVFIAFLVFLIMRFNESVYKLKGTLAFSTNGGNLCLVKLDNLRFRQSRIVTKPVFAVSHPNFSSDGNKLVFSKRGIRKSTDGYARLYSIVIFDLKENKIEDEFDVQYMECDYPVWSPDGRKIAFLAGYNLITGSEITPEGESPEFPSGNLYLYDIKIKEVKRISEVDAFHSNPSWINNQELIFASVNKDIIKVNSENKKEEKIEEIYGYALSYCPFNKKVAIRAKENIYISNLDGSELKYLVVSYNRKIESLPSGYPTELTWSPDGKFLIYAREGKCFDRMSVVSDMIVIDVNNPKITRKLYTGGGNFWGVSWKKQSEKTFENTKKTKGKTKGSDLNIRN